jgi:hypothetical protein
MARTLADCEDDPDRKLVRDIDEYGWHVLHITAESGLPGWSFSVGLFQTFGHPEVIVFGLPPKLSQGVINGLGSRIKAGNRLVADQEYADILANVRCMFRSVQRSWYKWLLGYARWYYEGDGFPVLQCIWPDKQQHYPWEAAFKAEWACLQPFLFQEDPVAARASELIESLKGNG